MLSVGKTAKLLGISIRTLHYYDEINLVKPSYTAPSGYRYYDDDAVELFQQVIFLRELEIPVKQIKKILQYFSGLRQGVSAQKPQTTSACPQSAY